MTPLFRDMIALHEGNAEELSTELAKSNVSPDDSGSFMSVVHRTIMDVRSLFNGLDESVLPGLIDGEKRNVAKYEEAMKDKALPPGVSALLAKQCGAIASKIAQMEIERATADRAAS